MVRGQAVTAPHVPHPFVRAFPRLSACWLFVAAVIGVLRAAGRRVWPWRRELVATGVLYGLLIVLDAAVPAWLALVVFLAALGGVVGFRPAASWVAGWLMCSVVRRRLSAGLRELRAVNASGKLPRLTRIRVTAIGEEVTVVARPGHSAELLDMRTEELRAAARCRDLRVVRDENASHRITLEVVRRDPLAATGDVVWEGHDAATLSMWDPVHIGMDENGRPVHLSLVERSLLGGGEPGSGKSSLANVIVAHAAKSPDAHLVLIDPNEVQFSPWRDRALAFATDDPADALEALALVQDEVRRRLALLRALPGVVRKVTPQIAAEHDLPLILLAVDELAYHTSVAGSSKQQEHFLTAARDVVARSRAAGVVPVMFTQRPTSEVVKTSLRDLFSVRCAFRTTTRTSSDVILGEGWARQGFSATDVDINARGVGWLWAEGSRPKRFKGAWLSDDSIADLSVTTVAYRPADAPSTPAPGLVLVPRPEVA